MEVSATAGLVAQWARYYDDHKMVSAAITWVHLAGVLLGGGLAVASDRTSLQLRPDEAGLAASLERLGRVHRPVVMGLAITLLAGLAMLFADLHTFLRAPLFWTKMALVAALLTNGYVRLVAERALGPDPAVGWRRFRVTSGLSLFLWFAILLAGAFLTTLS